MIELDELLDKLEAWSSVTSEYIRHVDGELMEAYRKYQAATPPLVLEGVEMNKTKKCWHISREVVSEIKLDGKCYRLPEMDDE